MAGPIRQPIDIAALERYIADHVPDIQVPIQVKQFGFGQSNPTYQLTDKNGGKFVMRKKPPGKLLSKTAHKVEREYRVIHALEQTDVPVPKAYCLCEDESVIGTPFYIMSFLDGRIIEDPSLPDVSPEERTEMWHDAIRTLGKFHRLSPAAVGLSTFGKPTGFYNRQMATFKTICAAQSQAVDVDTKKPVGKIPHEDEIIDFFKNPATQPKDRGTLIHGDYKIDNLVFHKTEPRVIGILDWEMSTVGHPLSDLVNLLLPHTISSPPPSVSSSPPAHPSFNPKRLTLGLPSKSQCIAWYAEVAGWDPTSEIAWGDAFGLFRSSVIMQGIAARYAQRQASSTRAMEYGSLLKPYGELAWGFCQLVKNQTAGGSRAKL